MSRANVIQTNFTTGEVSPLLYGRVDINKYFNGVRFLQNMLVCPQGGITRRPGTRFVKEVKDSAKTTLLQSFVFSDEQSYMLEFGDLYMRVYKDGGVVESSPGVALEVTTPWSQTEVEQLYFAQSADILWVCHPDHQPRIISRTSHTAWTIALYEPDNGPFLSDPVDVEALQPTISLVNDTATATAASGIFTAATTKVITACVQHSSFYFKLTVAAHGRANGDTVIIAGATRSSDGKAHKINGSWTITVIDANNYYLTTCYYDSAYATYTASSGTHSTPGGSASYVEYRKENEWRLAQILQASSTTIAQIDVIDRVLQYDQSIKVTFGAATGTITITADKVGAFKANDVGYYIRCNGGAHIGKWALITVFTDDQHVTASVMATVGSGVDIVITNRLIIGELLTLNPGFTDIEAGRWIRLSLSAETVYCKVSYANLDTQQQVILQAELPRDPNDPTRVSCDGKATKCWLGAWSDSTGWPAVVCFHKGRIGFARTETELQTLWLGVPGDFYDFTPVDTSNSQVTADHAITATLASTRANPIVWMESGPTLLVGTTGGEWQIKPASISEPLTPTNIEANEHTPFGSVSDMKPLRIGAATIFAQRGGKKIREMAYDFQLDAFVAKDLSIMSEHGFKDRVKKLAWSKEPRTTAWFILETGELVGLTLERDHDVTAFHRHNVGGIVESVAVVPTTDGDYDDVYLIVRRTINGSSKRYIERIDRPFDETLENMFFVECGLTYDSTPVTTITGLSHLEGATVDVVADGVYVGSRTVSSGSFTLTSAASVVHAGLPSSATIITLDPEGGSQAGTSQGKIKRIDKLDIRVNKSLPFKFKGNLHLDQMENPDFTQLYTGDWRVSLDQTYQESGSRGITITQTKPYPLTLIAIMPALNTNE